MTRLFPILLLILSVALAAGCGGGGSELSKAEYIKQADAICKKSNSTLSGEAFGYLKAHSKELAGLSNVSVRKRVNAAVIVPRVETTLKQLRALETPDGDTNELEAFYAAISKAAEKTEENPRDIEANAFNETHKLGRAYGFNNCAQLP